MLLGGDEFRRTLEKHREIFRFIRVMIPFRRAHPILSKEQFYTDAEIHWFGSRGGLPNWTDPREKSETALAEAK